MRGRLRRHGGHIASGGVRWTGHETTCGKGEFCRKLLSRMPCREEHLGKREATHAVTLKLSLGNHRFVNKISAYQLFRQLQRTCQPDQCFHAAHMSSQYAGSSNISSVSANLSNTVHHCVTAAKPLLATGVRATTNWQICQAVFKSAKLRAFWLEGQCPSDQEDATCLWEPSFHGSSLGHAGRNPLSA